MSGLVFKDLFTEKDGVSACPVRVAFWVVLAFILLATIADILFEGSKFLTVASDWIKAMAAYIFGGGSAIAGKNFTESSS